MIRKSLFFKFDIYLWHKRFVSSSPARLKKPVVSIIKPENLSTEHWKKILWVAMDLRRAVSENNKVCLKLLETKHVTLLFVKPHGRFQLAFTLACDLLGARRTLYYDPNFENQQNIADSGKVLSQLTDMFIIHGLHHDMLLKLTTNITVPLFSASCNVYCLQKALSDLMTFQEKCERLKGLTLAWVGPPTSIFNAYLLLCPQFGMNIQYVCICKYGSGKMSPVHKLSEEKIHEASNEYLKGFNTAEEAVAGADLIVTSMHPEEKNKVSLDLLKNAKKKWFFMHTLPRSTKEVTNDVFNHQNNLSWETSENYLYVAMAVILTSLKNYQPKVDIPDFEGVNGHQPCFS